MPSLDDFLRSSVTGNPSTKRLVVYRASMVLLAVLSMVGAACAWWIYRHGDLGSGAVAALTFVAGIAAALAGVAYRKPEGLGQSQADPSPAKQAAGSGAGEAIEATP